MIPFYKLTGSGNDFVFFDTRDWPASGDRLDPDGQPLYDTSVFYSVKGIQTLCARGTGVGADGVVFFDARPSLLTRTGNADVGIRYVNSDGSPAFCGNATLCTVRLAEYLGLVSAGGLRIATDAGVLSARLVGDVPEVDLGPVDRVTRAPPIDRASNESRVGYAVVGVPHLVVMVDDVDRVLLGKDGSGRGGTLRSDPWTGDAGANVNFFSPKPKAAGQWIMRTYERGVEGETLACGSGAVAVAALLVSWDLAPNMPIRVWTRSGAPLDVTISRHGESLHAALRGEGRLLFRGDLVDL
jgi:diaminopimelate epimerase